MPLSASDIIQLRLHNQKLSASILKDPAEVVHWLGAMQAQEYAMSKWGIALRLKTIIKDEGIEKSFNEGKILRTHLLRPTWHFVAPTDIRWLLTLTAPRVHAANAYMYRQLELDAKFFKRSNDILAKALEGKHLTRAALQTILKQKKISADGLRLGYIMMYAELEQLICSGARQGKQFTYALLDERVPTVKTVSREEALVKLTYRYFNSRGPATAQDFAYWSGLTIKDSLRGIDSLDSPFIREMFNNQEYIFSQPSSPLKKSKPGTTFLMPDYDEYGMSYKDRSILTTLKKLEGPRGGSIVYNRMLVINGRIEGTWQRTMNKNTADVTLAPFAPLSTTQKTAVTRAIKRFQIFCESPNDKKVKAKK